MVAANLKAPSSVAEYFDTARSPLNPGNVGYRFFVYGTFPLFAVKAMAGALGRSDYAHVDLVGRASSAAGRSRHRAAALSPGAAVDRTGRRTGCGGPARLQRDLDPAVALLHRRHLRRVLRHGVAPGAGAPRDDGGADPARGVRHRLRHRARLPGEPRAARPALPDRARAPAPGARRGVARDRPRRNRGGGHDGARVPTGAAVRVRRTGLRVVRARRRLREGARGHPPLRDRRGRLPAGRAVDRSPSGAVPGEEPARLGDRTSLGARIARRRAVVSRPAVLRTAIVASSCCAS